MMTLYDAFVPNCLQLLGSVSGLLGKAEDFCGERSIPAENIINARLAPDMFDFAYQVKSCAVHSAGAIEGARAGNFSPDRSPPPDSFTALHACINNAVKRLEAVTVADMEALVDRPITFTIGDRFRLDFIGKDFLTGFSLPNFYFHVTTAYAILRANGVRIGKTDYLGALRTRA